MPIIVTYLNPNMRPDIIEGESWFRLDTDSRGRGTIELKSLGDGGHHIIVNKSAVAKVEEFTTEAWAAMGEMQKKAEEAQAKARAEAERKAKTLKGRVKRLFGRG